MKTTKGLWIDHRKAVIVAVTDKGEEVKEIVSPVEKQPGRFEGARLTTPYEANSFRRTIRRRGALPDSSTNTTMR